MPLEYSNLKQKNLDNSIGRRIIGYPICPALCVDDGATGNKKEHDERHNFRN